MKKIILFAGVFCFLSSSVFAKAYFAGKKEMIEKAECIAIVEIKKTENIEQKGEHLTYRQKAICSVEKALKGNIEADIVIFGMEDFECAQCKFTEGRFLLFLRKDKNLWVSSNWHLGIRPIKNENVEWFKNGDYHFEMEEKPLTEVIAEIEKFLLEDEKSFNK